MLPHVLVVPQLDPELKETLDMLPIRYNVSSRVAGVALACTPQTEMILLTELSTNALRLCRTWRELGIELPVCLCGRKFREEDQWRGYQHGVDEILDLGTSTAVCAAKLVKMLVRPPVTRRALLRCKGFILDFARREVWDESGRSVPLRPREYEVLAVLAERPGVVHTRIQIAERIEERGDLASPEVIDVHVSNIRKQFQLIGADGPILTHPKVGYSVASIPGAMNQGWRAWTA